MADNIKKIIYKPQNGKLLRIETEVNDGVIEFIKIRGDFFIYPEEAIDGIESFLLGKKLSEIDDLLSEYLALKNIKVIGFSPKDIFDALNNV